MIKVARRIINGKFFREYPKPVDEAQTWYSVEETMENMEPIDLIAGPKQVGKMYLNKDAIMLACMEDGREVVYPGMVVFRCVMGKWIGQWSKLVWRWRTCGVVTDGVETPTRWAYANKAS